MLKELTTKAKVVGLKQTRRALATGKAKKVYLAYDADPYLTQPVEEDCHLRGIPVETSASMVQLGKACSIAVGTAAVAVIL